MHAMLARKYFDLIVNSHFLSDLIAEGTLPNKESLTLFREDPWYSLVGSFIAHETEDDALLYYPGFYVRDSEGLMGIAEMKKIHKPEHVSKKNCSLFGYRTIQPVAVRQRAHKTCRINGFICERTDGYFDLWWADNNARLRCIIRRAAVISPAETSISASFEDDGESI